MTITDERAADVKSLARGGIANLGGAAVSAVANFGLTVLVARFLSPVESGRFFTATSVFLVLETVSRLGADTGLVYFIARWRARGLRDRIAPGIRTAIAPAVAMGLVLAIVMFACAPAIAHEVGDPRGQSVGLLRLLAVLLPVAVCYDLCLGATRGFRTMRPTVLVEKVARPLAQLVLVFGALEIGLDSAIGFGWALPYVGAALAAAFFLRAQLRRAGVGELRTRRRWRAPATREFWAFALPRAAASVAQLALQRLDIVLVASLRGPREAAIYTAATRFLVVGQFVNQAINTVVQPHLSAAVSVGATARARDLYRVSTGWLVLASWPIFGLVAVFAPLYVRVFGSDYRSGTIVVVLLSIAMFVASGVGVVDSVMIMAGRTTWNMGTTFLALAVNVGVDLALIPGHGLVGAAIGWFCSIFVANVIPLAICWWRLHLHPFGASTYAAYALCGVCYVVVPVLAYVVTNGDLAGAVIGAALGSGGFLAGLVRWRNLFNLAGLRTLRRDGARSSP